MLFSIGLASTASFIAFDFDNRRRRFDSRQSIYYPSGGVQPSLMFNSFLKISFQNIKRLSRFYPKKSAGVFLPKSGSI